MVHQGQSWTKRRAFPGTATEVAFLLGGIGTGNVSLGSRGDLRDWEIFNKPNKGTRLPNTFFAIWAKEDGREPVAKVLESKISPPHNLSHGYHPQFNAGLPRLEKSTLLGEYPVARIEFEDRQLPLDVSLEAYTPMIPLNPEDSGIPGAVLAYRVRNRADRPVEVSIAGSLFNAVGGVHKDIFGGVHTPNGGFNVNEYRRDGELNGLFMYSNKFEPGDLLYGNMSLATTHRDVTYKRVWYRGGWFDYIHDFWDDFCGDGRLTDLGYEDPSADRHSDTGSIALHDTLQPGESKWFTFYLTWYFPNRINGWNETNRVKEKGRDITQNYYANLFDSSWAAARYLWEEGDRLRAETFKFRDALYSSTLPEEVIDALNGTMPVLRSTTCFWLKDGNFYGFEGCFDAEGCCDGTCTHVWSYAQTLAFLYPTLEISMRKNEFLMETSEDGKMDFRAMRRFDSRWVVPFSQEPMHAAADGQMGSIMRVYREWKLTGDNDFLRDVWPNVKKALKYGLIQWDKDGDLVFDGVQHNTYDIEFHGPNPLSAVYFLGALRAAEEMARFLGDEDAALYRDVFEKSSRRADELLWDGEYYVQRIEDVNAHKYQHGIGCLSDQLLGQEKAHVYGLGYLLPEEHVKSAVYAVYKYNFKKDLSDHACCQRTYALNDEQGLLLCTWPKGGRPRFPFAYSDEVWTGIEYQVAAHLIFEGFVEEGLEIVRGVRDRHDGVRRNPWNEVECGHHYARSMSSWGLLIALSGFEFDMVNGTMKFAPVVNRDQFRCFWSTGRAWGTFSQAKREDGRYDIDVQVLYGDAAGIKVYAGGQEITLG